MASPSAHRSRTSGCSPPMHQTTAESTGGTSSSLTARCSSLLVCEAEEVLETERLAGVAPLDRADVSLTFLCQLRLFLRYRNRFASGARQEVLGEDSGIGDQSGHQSAADDRGDEIGVLCLRNDSMR